MTPNRWVFLLGLMVLASSTRAQDYEFVPPAFPEGASGPVFSYFLPAHDGFAANVNLVVQPFAGDIHAYDELTRNQFEEFRVEVLEVQVTDEEIQYHYQGQLSGPYLRFFARAIRRGDKIFLITETALPSRWGSDGMVLKESVLNFKLKAASGR